MVEDFKKSCLRLLCWWFGCHLEDDPIGYPDYQICQRCGDCMDYYDLVSDTRHNFFKEWVSYWLFRKWLPAKCSECGHRFKHDSNVDHIPF